MQLLVRSRGLSMMNSHMPSTIYFYAAMFLAGIGFLGMHDTKPEKEETTFSKEEIKRALFKNKPFVMFVLIFILFQGPTTTNGVYMPLLITHMEAILYIDWDNAAACYAFRNASCLIFR